MSPFNVNSVLLVDDDDVSNFLNEMYINNLKLDIKVNAVLNGKRALDFLDQKETQLQTEDFGPCLLILDINMPVLNGWQFLDIYNERYSEALKSKIVIVMITVSEDERDIIRATDSPLIKEFIQKPLSDVKLIQILERYFLVKSLNPLPE